MKNILAGYIILLVRVASSQQISVAPEYQAGDSIILQAYGSSREEMYLHVSHSYGSALIKGIESKSSSTFRLPQVITRKAGKISFQLFAKDQKIWTGSTYISADTVYEAAIESYCGPKHLVVGKNDFTMITTSLTDYLDNPHPPGTPLTIRSMINAKSKTNRINSDGLIAFDRIYAPSNSGYGAVTATDGQVSSKEFRLDFYANDPAEFEVRIRKQHNYADGNQLVHLSTSVISDRFGNLIEDGALVYFRIEDTAGAYTIATAETIDGKAHVELPAPTYATSWTVSADIPFFTNSATTTSTRFDPAYAELPFYVFDEGLLIGPIKSFMDQLARDGLLVEINFESSGSKRSFVLPLKNGEVYIDFQRQLISKGDYRVTMKMGELEKETNITVKR